MTSFQPPLSPADTRVAVAAGAGGCPEVFGHGAAPAAVRAWAPAAATRAGSRIHSP